MFLAFLIFFGNTPDKAVCSSHVTYAFQSESTLYSSLNVKELLARNRRKIWSLSECNWTRTHNHLVRKRKLNHLVFVYELSGFGFESISSHLNSWQAWNCLFTLVPKYYSELGVSQNDFRLNPLQTNFAVTSEQKMMLIWIFHKWWNMLTLENSDSNVTVVEDDLTFDFTQFLLD